MDRPLLVDIWYQALRSPPGIPVESSDVKRLQTDLYRVRQELADPDLANLFLTPSRDDPENCLWIVHKTITVPDEEPAPTEAPSDVQE